MRLFSTRESRRGKPGQESPNGRIPCQIVPSVLISAVKGFTQILFVGEFAFNSETSNGFDRGGLAGVHTSSLTIVARTVDSQWAGYPMLPQMGDDSKQYSQVQGSFYK